MTKKQITICPIPHNVQPIYSVYFQTLTSPSSLVDSNKPAVCGHHSTVFTSCKWARCTLNASSNVGWFLSDTSASLNILIMSSPLPVASKPASRSNETANQYSFSHQQLWNDSLTSQFAPWNVVNTARMIAWYCANTLPYCCIVWRGDPFFVARLIGLPNFHRSIVTARCQPFAGCVKRNTPHCRFVPIQRVQTRPIIVGWIFGVQFDCVVVAGRGQNIGVRMPFDFLDILLMCIEHGRTLEFIFANHFPYPHRFVATACCQQMARLRPRHTFHFIFVTFQRCVAFKFAGFFVPNGCCCVETGRRQEFTVPWPCDTANRSRMAVRENGFCFPFLVALLWPNANSFVFAAPATCRNFGI